MEGPDDGTDEMNDFLNRLSVSAESLLNDVCGPVLTKDAFVSLIDSQTIPNDEREFVYDALIDEAERSVANSQKTKKKSGKKPKAQKKGWEVVAAKKVNAGLKEKKRAAEEEARLKKEKEEKKQAELAAKEAAEQAMLAKIAKEKAEIEAKEKAAKAAADQAAKNAAVAPGVAAAADGDAVADVDADIVHPDVASYLDGFADIPNAPLSASVEQTLSSTISDVLSQCKRNRLITYLDQYRNMRVRVVLRPDLEAAFRAKWDEFRANYNNDINLCRPRVCFHGTKPNLLPLIIEGGLKVPDGDKVKHSSDTGWWGKGIYTSHDPDYSAGYSADGRLICCAVLLGKVYNCVERRDGGPCEPGFDSHVAESGCEWVLFSNSQVLPLFVLESRDVKYEDPIPVAVAQPAVPVAQPAIPVAVAQPAVPVAQPAVPVAVAQPAVPVAQPAIPIAQPVVPVAVAQPAIPVAQPAIPVAQPAIPVAQPEIPVAVAQPAVPVAHSVQPVDESTPAVVSDPADETEENDGNSSFCSVM